MSEARIFAYGAVASILCLIFLIITLNEFRKVGKGAGIPERNEKN